MRIKKLDNSYMIENCLIHKAIINVVPKMQYEAFFAIKEDEVYKPSVICLTGPYKGCIFEYIETHVDGYPVREIGASISIDIYLGWKDMKSQHSILEIQNEADRLNKNNKHAIVINKQLTDLFGE